INNGNLTIAGQTAPGGGIQISGQLTGNSLLNIYASNVVVQYLKLRHGYGSGTVTQDGDCIGAYGKNIMIDHCTVMWTTDENTSSWAVSANQINNVTWSWCLLAEPMLSHPTNLLTGGNTSTIADGMVNLDAHHCLFSNSSHRNPLVMIKSFRFVNNIVYNWKYRATHMSGGANVDIIGNLYKAGPITPSTSNYEICAYPLSQGEGQAAFGSPSIYAVGNQGPHVSNPASDNWVMVRETNSENGSNPTVGPLSTTYKRTTPMAALPYPIPVTAVGSLAAAIIPTVGASRRLDANGAWVANRDAVDTRLINEYNAGTGILPAHEDDVGGFPVIASGTAYADTDQDGMADAWEMAQFGN
ncbi:MAG: hypothetical protein Q8N13_23545, partial [Acidovorax sp.]|nr:hypothetical protein [Acidovorax sp.]